MLRGKFQGFRFFEPGQPFLIFAVLGSNYDQLKCSENFLCISETFILMATSWSVKE